MCCQSFFYFSLQKKQQIHSPKTSLPMFKRPLWSFSYFHHSWCATDWGTSGWIHTLAQVVSRMAVPVPLPDADTAAPGVNPAGRRPVQLANAGWQHPTSCSTNLIQRPSFMYMIMYKICTQEKCKNSITFGVTLLSLSCVFLCASSWISPRELES